MPRSGEEKGRYRPDVQEMLNERSEDAREITARFFGVTPEEITFTHSISEGLNIVSEGIDWKAGDEVIITDQEHPSGYMPWALRADQQGVILKQLRLLPEPEGMVDRLRNLLTDRTRVVALNHVTSSLGIRERLSEIPGARVQTPAEFSAGAVNVAIEGVDPGAVRQALWDKYRIVAVSPAGGMRFSITFFTTREEIDRVVEALKQEIA